MRRIVFVSVHLTCIRTCVYIYLCTCIYLYEKSIHVYIWIYMHIYTYTNICIYMASKSATFPYAIGVADQVV